MRWRCPSAGFLQVRSWLNEFQRRSLLKALPSFRARAATENWRSVSGSACRSVDRRGEIIE